MKGLALIALLILLAVPQARAAEPVPGNSCAGYNANSFQWAGGPENNGATNGMFCKGGLWTGIINFQSSGNVGIDTTSPADPLQVVSTRGGEYGAGIDTLKVQNTNSSSGTAAVIGLYANGESDFDIGVTNSSNSPAGEAYLLNRNAGPMVFETNNSTAMTITSTGNVGIGTTGPTLLLDVEGATSSPATSGTTPNGLQVFRTTSGNSLYVGGNSASPYGMWLQASNFTNLSWTYPILLNPTGGDVGIGTTGPATSLDVNGDITDENVKSCAQVGTDSTGKLICKTPAMTLIATLTASASASLAFNGANWSSSYNTLFLNCAGLISNSGTNNIMVRVGEGAGPTWESGAHYSVVGEYNNASIAYATNLTDLTASLGGSNSTTKPTAFKMYLDNVASSTGYKMATIQISEYSDAAAKIYSVYLSSYWNNDKNAITGIEVVTDASTIASGTCSLYGMN